MSDLAAKLAFTSKTKQQQKKKKKIKQSHPCCLGFECVGGRMWACVCVCEYPLHLSAHVHFMFACGPLCVCTLHQNSHN